MVPSMYRMNSCPTLIPNEYCFAWKDEIWKMLNVLWMLFYVCKRTKCQWQCTSSWSLLENKLWKGLVSSWRFIPRSLSSRSHPWPHIFVCICLSLSDCQNAFALVVRPPTEQENLLFSFKLTAEDTLKSAWLKTLCRQVANTICRADAVSEHAHTNTHTYRNMVTSSSDHPPQAWNRTQLFILLALLSFIVAIN